MEKDNWTVIKEFYKETFGFPEGLVELASVQDILKMCVSGSSNKTISEFLDIKDSCVNYAILDFLNFQGFYLDLDFNPYKLYLSLDSKTLIEYKKTVSEVTGFQSETEFIENLFRICQQYYKYEDMIKNEWY